MKNMKSMKSMNSNYELIQYFLDEIKEFTISNPDKNITKEFIYSLLMQFNIQNYQMPLQSTKGHWNNWENRYISNSNINVFRSDKMKHFLFFTKGKLSGNEIKLYVPLDFQHLENGANQLFDFISSKDISHQSKISDVIRNDDIVIRVNNLKDAQDIINFISSNSYLQEGLMKVNPFLPTCNGVGLAMDNNYSYNSTICMVISEFVNYLKQQNKIQFLTVQNLNTYIRNNINNIKDLDLKDIYSLLAKTTSKNYKLQDFVNHANNKLVDEYNSKRERITDNKFYFEKAIIITNKVHPGNEKTAILEYLKGNPNYFTNQQSAREGLIKYVHPRDLISLMRNELSKNNIKIPNSDSELVNNYLNLLLNRKNLNNDNVIDKFNVIKTAYINTFNKYGFRQARAALTNLLINGESKFFTNDFKDRDKIKLILVDDNIKKIILENIDINNLNINNINEIVDRFILVITETKKQAVY